MDTKGLGKGCVPCDYNSTHLELSAHLHDIVVDQRILAVKVNLFGHVVEKPADLGSEVNHVRRFDAGEKLPGCVRIAANKPAHITQKTQILIFPDMIELLMRDNEVIHVVIS